MKKLAVDVTFLHDQYYRRGIGRYGREIVSRMVTKPNRKAELHLIGFEDLESNIARLELEGKANLSGLEFHSLGKAQLSRPLANFMIYHRKVKPLLKSIQPDLYFATQFDRLPPSAIVPTATTVYDLIPFILNKYSRKGPVLNFFKGLYYKYAWRKASRSKLILAISEFTKQDILRRTTLQNKTVKMIHLGVSDVFYKQADPVLVNFLLKRHELEQGEYLIYDSGHEANKNTLKLIDLITELKAAGIEMPLVITGGDFKLEGTQYLPTNNQSIAFWEYAETKNVQNLIHPTGVLQEDEMAALFQNALAYVNFSMYEGFGFGPVQAMAAGIPTIVSNLSSFPEVAGDAALLVDPNNFISHLPEIKQLLTSPEERQRRIELGKERAMMFDWDDCFKKTWKALLSTIESK